MSFERHYTRCHAVLRRHGTVVALAAGLVYVLATSGIANLRLDLSFRPLFASGAGIAAETAAFEAEFGQASGAWIAAILENRGAEPAEFVRLLSRLSALAETVDGVVEVRSLTHARLPRWSRGRLTTAAPIPRRLLESLDARDLEEQFELLLDGTRFVGWLVSADGSRLLLAARVDAPLDDLPARRRIVREFRDVIDMNLPPDAGVDFTGVSVIELAYERQVLRDQLAATALTSAALIVLLFATFGRVSAVVACVLPVTLAIPFTLGVQAWLGQPVTIINTVIPVVVLVIGVADAVHMLTAWLEARGRGLGPDAATGRMLHDTGRACFLTTVTTVAGFLALESAELEAIGNFGLAAAIGIAAAWCANQLLLPWLLRRLETGPGLRLGVINRLAGTAVAGSFRLARSRPWTVLAVSVALTAACCSLIPGLAVDQRFNEELPAAHPASLGQRILERDFGGFLGPEISIARKNGAAIVDDEAIARLAAFVAAVRGLPATRRVWSILDLLPRRIDEAARTNMIAKLREEPALAKQVSELVNANLTRLAVIARIGDIGTESAGAYRDLVLELAEAHFGDAWQVQVVGQWWLAQHGMRLLLRDMLASLATATLIVLPLLWLAIRRWRLIVAATAANVLPLCLPLAVMAAAGITLRIGTAMVLAIALGIVVDNTLHIASRLRHERAGAPGTDADRSLQATGRAVVFTTLALVAGFLSMLANQLMAIRDMGLVAAVTFAGAMLADLLLLPAIDAALRPVAPRPARAGAPG